MDTGNEYAFNEEDGQWEELPSSGGGGGGSSDFSMAAVTITYGQQFCPIMGAFVDSNGTWSAVPDGFSSGDTATLILYKGSANVWSNETVVSTSGDIELDEETGYYIVSGDCTITTT